MADNDSNNDTFILNESKLVIDSDLKFYKVGKNLTTSNHHRRISSHSRQTPLEIHRNMDKKKF